MAINWSNPTLRGFAGARCQRKNVFQAFSTAGAFSFGKSGFDSQKGINVTTLTTGAPGLFDKLLAHQISNADVGGK